MQPLTAAPGHTQPAAPESPFRRHTRAYRPLLAPDAERPTSAFIIDPVNEQLQAAAAQKGQALAKRIEEEGNTEAE